MSTGRFVIRYRSGTRLNHWIVAILFFCAGLSGLAFFHPYFFPLANLFGGGPVARILHPFFGVAMAVLFCGLFVVLWRENLIDDNDWKWIEHSKEMLAGHEENMPPVGRYNAGQKFLFWTMVGCLAVLLVTGIMFWRPYFAASFPIEVVRAATLLHAVAATVLVLGIIVHIYAAIWVKGTMRAMTRGTVTEAWARHHHPLWRAEVTDREQV